MSNALLSKANVLAFIKASIMAEVQKQMSLSIEKAQKEIEVCLKEKVDSIALKMLKNYRVEMGIDEIVIRVDIKP